MLPNLLNSITFERLEVALLEVIIIPWTWHLWYYCVIFTESDAGGDDDKTGNGVTNEGPVTVSTVDTGY